MLDINGVTICYGPLEVVHSVLMHVEQGKIVALIGPNGAGKSSILRAISGLIRPSSGDIIFLGASLVGLPPHEIAALGIAHVMEGRHLFGGLSVEDNLVLAESSIASASAGSMEAVFRRFPILGQRLYQLAGTLSGGEQQMLAIGRALMGRPRLIMLDEPSWGLAPRVVRELLQTFNELRTEGITVLLVEQMANLALKVCDYGYVMSNGRIVLEGTAQELMSNPSLHASYLGGDVSTVKEAVTKHGPQPEAATKQKEMPKSVERIDRTFGEKERKERQEKAKRLETHLPEASLRSLRQPKEQPRQLGPKSFEEQERLRQIRQQSFSSDTRFSELKEELGRIRKEVTDLKEVRIIPEDKTSFSPPNLRKDRLALEKLRQKKQAAWGPKEMSESVVGMSSQESRFDWTSRELLRKERQSSFPSETKETPASGHLDYAKHEMDRRRRQQTFKGDSYLEQEKETRMPAYQAAVRDRKDFEFRRTEKQKGWSGEVSDTAFQGQGNGLIDRAARELDRQKRQATWEKEHTKRTSDDT